MLLELLLLLPLFGVETTLGAALLDSSGMGVPPLLLLLLLLRLRLRLRLATVSLGDSGGREILNAKGEGESEAAAERGVEVVVVAHEEDEEGEDAGGGIGADAIEQVEDCEAASVAAANRLMALLLLSLPLPLLLLESAGGAVAAVEAVEGDLPMDGAESGEDGACAPGCVRTATGAVTLRCAFDGTVAIDVVVALSAPPPAPPVARVGEKHAAGGGPLGERM